MNHIFLVNSGPYIGRHGTIETLDQSLHPGFCRITFMGDGGGQEVLRLVRLSTASRLGDDEILRRRYAEALGGKGGTSAAAAKAVDKLARDMVAKGKPLKLDPKRAGIDATAWP